MAKIYTTAEQIVRIYLRKIVLGELLPGDKIESEEKLSAILNLSRSTCRNALLQLETMGIVSGSRGRVRCITPEAHKLAESLYEDLSYNYSGKKIAFVILDDRKYLASMRDEALKRSALFNWTLDVFYNTDQEKEFQSFEKIVEYKYDGCIIIPLRNNSGCVAYNYEILKKAQIPFVLLGRPPRAFSCDALFANDYLGSYSMTKWLYKCGAKQVVYITKYNEDFVVNSDRQQAYEDWQDVNKHVKKVFDVGKSTFEKEFLAYLSEYRRKIGLNVYCDDLVEPVFDCLKKAKRERNRDFEIISWAESELLSEEQDKKCCLVRVPREAMISRAFELLLTRISYGPSESHIHEIFEIKLPSDNKIKK